MPQTLRQNCARTLTALAPMLIAGCATPQATSGQLQALNLELAAANARIVMLEMRERDMNDDDDFAGPDEPLCTTAEIAGLSKSPAAPHLRRSTAR